MRHGPGTAAHIASLTAGVVALFRAAGADAATYYVAPGGAGDGSQASPWGSIAAAVASSSPVQAGDTIIVKAGTYSISSIAVQKSGAAGSPITLKAEAGVVLTATASAGGGGSIDLNGTHDFVLDGFRLENAPRYGIALHGCTNVTVRNCHVYKPAASAIMINVSNWGANDIYPVPQNFGIKILDNTLEQANWSSGDNEGISLWAADGFEVAGNTLIDCQREGIDVKVGARNGSVHHNTVRGQYNKWSGTGMGVYIDAWHYETFNIDVHDNLIHDSEEGFEINCEDCNKPGTTGSVHDVRVFNNVVYHNTDIQSSGWKGRGMSFYDCCDTGPHPVHDVHVFNNTFVGSQLIGISVENPVAQNLFIRNNIVVGHGSTDINVAKAQSVTVENNMVSKAISNAAGTACTMSGNTVADPLFVNAVAYDLHLQSGSPAIDRAAGTDVATTDFDGKSRPVGAAADLGAYEYGAAAGSGGATGGGGAIGGGGASGAGGAGTGGSTTGDGGSSPGSGGRSADGGTGGCSCSTGSRDAHGALLLAPFAVIALARRRRLARPPATSG